MEAKFHVTPQGVKPCRASKKACKYGEAAHTVTREEAQKLLEEQEAVRTKTTALKGTKKAGPTKASQEKPHRGVSVSRNEHLVVQAMVEGNLAEAAVAITALPQEERTDAFKDRDAAEAEVILRKLQQALRKRYGEEEVFTAPEGNRNAQDLRAVHANRDVELKIGYAYTDSAIGITTAAFFLPSTVTEKLPTQKDRQERIRLYHRGEREEAKAHFQRQLASITALERQEVAPEQARALNLFMAGVNRREELEEHLSRPEEGLRKPSYDFIAAKKPKKGELPTWEVRETYPYLPDRTWTVSTGATTTEEGKTPRLNLIFEGSDGSTMRFVYNQKNHYPVTMASALGGGVERTGYEYGLGSPSFNVWLHQGPAVTP